MKDGTVQFWDFQKQNSISVWKTDSLVHCFDFCPTRFWIAVGTEKGIYLRDLETFETKLYCKEWNVKALKWATDGETVLCTRKDEIVSLTISI